MNHADLDRIARAHGIRLLLQFGSTVTGRVHAKSDVEVAVLLERPSQTLEERTAMVHDLKVLEELFRHDVLSPVPGTSSATLCADNPWRVAIDAEGRRRSSSRRRPKT